MASARRASIGTMELDINKARWNFQNKCVEDAEYQLSQNNLDAAAELCAKALEHDAGFFPALILKKRLEKRKQIYSANLKDQPPTLRFEESEDTLSSSESDSDLEPPEVSRSKSIAERTGTPMPIKGVLKNANAGSSRNGSGESSPIFGDVYHEKRSRVKMLKKLLLKSHGRLILPSDLLEKIEQLRNTDDDDFECPKCTRGFDKGHMMLSHFVRRHFPVFGEGKILKPFVCKTCQKGFTSGSDLLVHATADHPTCKWLTRFKDLLQSD